MTPGLPSIGVLLDGRQGAGSELTAEVVATELLCRLPGADVRLIDLGPGDAGPASSRFPRIRPAPGGPLTGVVVAGDGAGAQAEQLRRLGAVVVTLRDEVAPARLPVASLLGDRLFDAAVLDGRSDQLRLGGVLPPQGGVLLGVFLSDPPDERTLTGLAVLAADQHLGLVVVPPVAGPTAAGPEGEARDTDRVHAVGPAADPIDLAAAAWAADVVVADDPVVAGLALSLGRPTVVLAGGAGDGAMWPAGAVVVDDVDRVAAALGPARTRAEDATERQPARDRLDHALDAAAGTIRELRGARPTQAVESLLERIGVLETAHRGLERRVRAERLAFGAVARSALRPPPVDERQRLWARAVAAEAAEAAATSRARDADAEATRAGGALQAAGRAIAARDGELTRLRAAHSRLLAEAGTLRAELTETRSGLDRSRGEVARLQSQVGSLTAEVAALRPVPAPRAGLLVRALTALRIRGG
jgi:hypothetical protein